MIFNCRQEWILIVAGHADILYKLPSPLLNPPRPNTYNLEKLDAGYVQYDYSEKFDVITP